MNLIQDVRLMEWIFQRSLDASILVLLVVLVSWIFRKILNPSWRYGLWMLVVIKLVMPVSLESSLSIFNLHNQLNKPGQLKDHTVSHPFSSRKTGVGNQRTFTMSEAKPKWQAFSQMR